MATTNLEEVSVCEILEEHLTLVMKVAHAYRRYGIEWEDLVQYGNLGLVKASMQYDESRCPVFSAYAVFCIKVEIKKALQQHFSVVRHSSNQIYRQQLIRRATEKFRQENDRDPDIDELEKLTGIRKKFIIKTLTNAVKGIVSMNAQCDDSSESTSTSLEDFVTSISGTQDSPFDELESSDLIDMVLKRFDLLTDRDRDIMIMRYIDEKTFREIGEKYSLTAPGVRAVCESILSKIREEFDIK